MILAILQARMSSTRLPGKVLKPIMGQPMLELQIERVSRCKGLDRIIVATSTHDEDSAIVQLCKGLGIGFYRGDLNNVLDRYYRAARQFGADHVVRITGDCPLIDPVFIDRLIAFYMARGSDYASNCRPPTLPDGLDAEIFSFAALEQAWNEATDPFELEHVMSFILKHPERFSISNFQHKENLSHLRWTVDEPEDFDMVSQIYEALYPKKPRFGTEDVLGFLKKHPDLTMLNERHKQKRRFEKIHDDPDQLTCP